MKNPNQSLQPDIWKFPRNFPVVKVDRDASPTSFKHNPRVKLGMVSAGAVVLCVATDLRDMGIKPTEVIRT